MPKHLSLTRPSAVLGGLLVALSAGAEDGQDTQSPDAAAPTEDLAWFVENPFAFIPRLPIENQFDFGLGSEDSMQYTLRPRPIIPFSLGEDYAVVTRTTVPIVYREAPEPGLEDRFGFADIDQEFYFTRKYVEPGGALIGFGPILRYPSASYDELGGGKWGAGPAVAVSYQCQRWTFGLFVNHLWSYAGESDRQSLNATYLQPFVAYTTEGNTTFGLDTQSTYDWSNEQWTAPFNLTVSQLVKIAEQSVVFTLGGRYYADQPPGGPEWGMQASLNILFARYR